MIYTIEDTFGSWNDFWVFIGIGAAIFAGILLSFWICRSVRILRWLFMLTGGGLFLFFSIFALVQYQKYNAAWQADFIDSGYIVWAHHWSYMKVKQEFSLALSASCSLVFLFIFADRAFDVDYVEKKTDVYLENEYSWFTPTTIVFEEYYKKHTYFLKVLLFGLGAGISLGNIAEIVTLFASSADHYFYTYIIDIVIAGLTLLLLVFIFIRTVIKTREAY